MPLTCTETEARFDDVCSVEEALTLLEFLKATPGATVDLRRCSYIHTALLQQVLLLRPTITGWPEDPSLAGWLEPFLTEPLAGPPRN
jgi:hypothetical protein